MKKITLTLAAIMIAGMTGCASHPGKVSKGDLSKIRNASDSVTVGMEQDEVLKAYRRANKVRLASASVNGVEIEEWKIEAYHDDNWDKSRDLFVRFLYFADGDLVDSSDSRLEFRDDPELVERWSAE